MGFWNWFNLYCKNGNEACAMQRRYLNFAYFLGLMPVFIYSTSGLLLTDHFGPTLDQIDQDLQGSILRPILAACLVTIMLAGMIPATALLMPIFLYITCVLGKLTTEEARNIYFYSYYPSRWFPNGRRPFSY